MIYGKNKMGQISGTSQGTAPYTENHVNNSLRGRGQATEIASTCIFVSVGSWFYSFVQLTSCQHANTHVLTEILPV